MITVTKKLEDLRNGIYSVVFDKKDFSRINQSTSSKLILANSGILLTQAAYTLQDYIAWFVNGYLWNLPEFISKYGNMPLPEIIGKIPEYASQMNIAQAITGSVGWICSILTIVGFVKAYHHLRKPKVEQ
jgi:hypothetical protein